MFQYIKKTNTKNTIRIFWEKPKNQENQFKIQQKKKEKKKSSQIEDLYSNAVN